MGFWLVFDKVDSKEIERDVYNNEETSKDSWHGYGKVYSYLYDVWSIFLRL